jgi:alanyl-tRNA synthetase
MQQFVPNLLGAPHPSGSRVWNIQRCVRAQDIDEVGDNRHDTFFEMIGNWSFGDYFKKEQLPWMFDLYTNDTYGFGLDPKRLYVSVFAGGDGIERDEESIAIWKDIFAKFGIKADVGTAQTWHPDQRITTYDAYKNWWSRAGAPAQMPAGEIGGPDSELFYDFGERYHDATKDPSVHPNSDSGRFMEIGNSVFIQYQKMPDGSLSELPKKNVDFGGGLERILAAIHNDPDVFATDVFAPIVECLTPGYSHIPESEKRPYRIIADHVRTAVQLAADGVLPAPKEQGYVMRKLLRRAVNTARAKNIGMQQLFSAVSATMSVFAQVHEGIRSPNIYEIVTNEIRKYDQALLHGKKQIEKLVKTRPQLTGQDVFDLYQSTGVPPEDVADIARELGARVDLGGLEEARVKHTHISRSGGSRKFKGGLADNSEQTIRYHTATHILHQALFITCGSSIRQEGSNITGERLRFDFLCDHKPTEEELKRVQSIVDDVITSGLPVECTHMSKETAFALGAKSFFREKYPDEVSVYSIGGAPYQDASGAFHLPHTTFSLELCGGPHVSNTHEIGKITIYKLEKIGKDLYRVYAK